MKFKLVEDIFNIKNKDQYLYKYDIVMKQALDELLGACDFLGYFLEERNNTRYIKNNLAGKLIQCGNVNMSGEKFYSYEDVAYYARMFRDTRFETFRIIYMKESETAGMDMVSSHLPDRTSFLHKKDYDIGIAKYKAKMIRLGANGYYILHNHPSGVMRKSDADIQITKYFISNLSGFLGHIIIGKEKWGFIDSELNFYSYNYLDEQDVDYINIKSPRAICEFGKDYLDKRVEYSLIFYIDNDNNLSDVQEIKNTEFHDKQIGNYIINEKKKNGCTTAYLYTEDLQTFVDAKDLLFQRYINNSIYYDVDKNYSILGSEAYSNQSKLNPIIKEDMKISYNISYFID